MLKGRDYARLIAEVPNLVATKTTSGGLEGAEDLLRHSAELMHFMSEANFPHGSMYGSVGLLSSYGELVPKMSFEFFEAGQRRDVEPLFRMQHQFETLNTDLWEAATSAPTKLRMLPDFPLRLLSPYQSFTDDDYRAIKRVLDERYGDWE